MSTLTTIVLVKEELPADHDLTDPNITDRVASASKLVSEKLNTDFSDHPDCSELVTQLATSYAIYLCYRKLGAIRRGSKTSSPDVGTLNKQDADATIVKILAGDIHLPEMKMEAEAECDDEIFTEDEFDVNDLD